MMKGKQRSSSATAGVTPPGAQARHAGVPQPHGHRGAPSRARAAGAQRPEPVTGVGCTQALRALIAGLCLLAAGPGTAGIRTDGTVGPSRTLTGAMTIDQGLGTRAGDNLFHSFERFDIATGESATFTGSADIANVISRVTGGTPSSIDGLLKSEIGHAAFFLINPKGVVFGPNATVDVPGAFHVSTADRLNFPDGYYSATDTEHSTLSMAAPESFGFLVDRAPADITVRGSQLAFKSGTTVSLVGGNVTVTADSETFSFARIESQGGDVRVVAVGRPDAENRIAVRDGSSTLAPKGRAEVSEGSTLDVSGFTGPESILLRGATVAVLGDSSLVVGHNGANASAGVIRVDAGALEITDSKIDSTVSGAGRGADIVVTADRLTIDAALAWDGVSRISTRIAAGATGAAGDVRIDARRIALTNGGQINTLVMPTAQGAGGALDLRVSESVAASGWNDLGAYSGIASMTRSLYAARGGDILIQSPDAALRLTNGAIIQAGTTGSGNSGAIRIAVRSLDASGDAWVYAPTAGGGSAGDLTIAVADSMTLASGAGVGAWSGGAGAAGKLAITIKGSLVMDGAWLETSASAGGAAGEIAIDAGREILMDNGSVVMAGTTGLGRAGAIGLTAGGVVALTNGSNLYADSGAKFAAGKYVDTKLGDAGRITIDAGSVTLLDSSLVVSSANRANAGVIDVTATGDIRIDSTTGVAQGLLAGNTRPLTAVPLDPTRLALEGRSGTVRLTANDITLANKAMIDIGTTAGDGGSVGIKARTLSLLDGASIRAVTSAAGAAGGIRAQATGNILMSDAAFMSAATTGQGRGSAIVLTADGVMELTNGSYLFASTTGPGAAGDVTLRAGRSMTLDGGASIESWSRGVGAAGNLTIDVGGSFLMHTGAWLDTAATAGGGAGDIGIHAGGDIRLSDWAYASASTVGQGRAGAIGLRAGGAVELTNAVFLFAESGALTDAAGNYLDTRLGEAGRITIDAGSLTLLNSGLSVVSSNLAGAGVIDLSARGDLRIEGATGLLDGLQAQNQRPVTAAPLDPTQVAQAGRAGTVALRAPRITVGQGAIINISSNAGDGGVLSIDAGSLSLRDAALINAFTRANGAAGDIAIQTIGDLLMSDGATVTASTVGQGTAGTITLSVGGSLELTNGSHVSAFSGALADAAGHYLDTRLGDAGRITIEAGAVTLRDSGLLVTSSNRANAGAIDLSVRDTLLIDSTTGEPDGLWAANMRPVTAPPLDPTRTAHEGRSGSIRLTAAGITAANGAIIDISSSAGDGGAVTVDTGALNLLDGATIWAIPTGPGAGGDIAITVSGALAILGKHPRYGTGAGILTANANPASHAALVGPAGAIDITAATLTIGYGGAIDSSSFASSGAAAGAITLQVGRLAVRDGGAILSATTGAGAAGDIRIDALEQVLVAGLAGSPSTISAASGSPLPGADQGRGGNIRISAPEVLIEQGGEIASQTYGAAAAGSVTLSADRLIVRAGAEINTDSAGELGNGPAGAIDIQAGVVVLDGRGAETLSDLWRQTGILSTSAPGGGAAGNIRIQASAGMDIIGGATLSTSTASAGDAGDIAVTAPTLTIDNALLASRAEAGATGFAGAIDLTVGLLDLRNQGEISIESNQRVSGERLAFTPDNRIHIAATDLRLTTGGTISAASTGNVRAGAIEINGQTLSASGGASIQSDAAGSGAAGRIALQVAAITLDGAEVRAATSGSGAGGALGITGQTLNAASGARVRTDTSGSGAAGRVDITLGGLLALAPGTELSTSTSGGGDAGRIGVTVGSLDLNNAALTSRAEPGATGQAGAIAVSAGAIDLRNAAQISSASNQGLAAARRAGVPAGQITISAAALRLDGASGITAASTGSVPAGSINITAGALSLAGQSRITTESVNADGGAIGIDARSLWLTDSQITTSVLGTTGSGGDIRIRTGLLGLAGGFIQANTAAAGAAGGDLSIVAERVIASRGFVQVGGNERLAFRPGSGLNVIQAAAPAGVQGNIMTTVPQLDVTKGLTALEVPVGDPAALVRDRCLVGSALAGSSLVEQPVAGLPPAPAAPAVVSFAGERLDLLLAGG